MAAFSWAYCAAVMATRLRGSRALRRMHQQRFAGNAAAAPAAPAPGRLVRYPVLAAAVDTGAREFRERVAAMAVLVADLDSRTATARAGGGAKALALAAARGKVWRRALDALAFARAAGRGGRGACVVPARGGRAC